MNAKITKALETFRSGRNCAQTVLITFTADLEVDSNLALDLSSGFGAGMGRLQETCGAVTGAFMVLGLYNSRICLTEDETKESTISMIQNFSKKFIRIHGVTDCKSLLKCDLKTEEGQKEYRQYHLSERVCEKCIQNSVSIVQELIEK